MCRYSVLLFCGIRHGRHVHNGSRQHTDIRLQHFKQLLLQHESGLCIWNRKLHYWNSNGTQWCADQDTELFQRFWFRWHLGFECSRKRRLSVSETDHHAAGQLCGTDCRNGSNRQQNGRQVSCKHQKQSSFLRRRAGWGDHFREHPISGGDQRHNV